MQNPLKIKVCGMRQPENIKELVALKPDYIGLIFYPKSKRFVSNEEAIEINKVIPKQILKVGVFVNEYIPNILSRVTLFGLSAIQLHGDESPEYCRNLKDLGIPIIKAFGINETFDFRVLNDYETSCDYFLFDTKAAERGGTGEKFDWKILNNYTLSKPLFLSGGIGPEDTEDILSIKGLSIYSLDINSRFEVQPALKDIEKLKKFINEIRLTNS
jgi:phosphoribosylanthranilate isomerase